jgi:hypothetical protein
MDTDKTGGKMSVAGYIGKNVKSPRKLRDLLNDDLKDEARKDAELKSLELKRQTEAYESVLDYDPVLRAHCRL